MNKQIVLDFVEAVNAADIERMYLLMSEDHLFLDANLRELAGRDSMREAWIAYLQLFPDYRIEVMHSLEEEDMVVVLGFASGTFGQGPGDGNHFRLPAAWKALVREGKISHWQVYCDTRERMEILSKNGIRL